MLIQGHKKHSISDFNGETW